MKELKEIIDRLNKLTWQLDDKYLFEIECAIDHLLWATKEMDDDNYE